MTRLASTLLAIASVLAIPAGAQIGSHQHEAPTGQREQTSEPSSAFTRAMSEAMDLMHKDMSEAPGTGDPDRDFLAMMIPHHAGAVDMARLVLIYGRDPLVRQLAEEIIASQQAEISAMSARLNVLQRGPDPLPEGFPAITGTRGR
jgi:uncharacterized protein (DUF305 family)